MSSFRKREVQKPIPGTRTSPQTGQIITSSGNPSLDALLGGGLPIGSILLIEEDKYVTHSKVLAKYFLAEGICSEQFCFLGSYDDTPTEMLLKLPMPLPNHEDRISEKNNGTPDKNGLRIAWRYNDLPIINSEQSSIKIGHNFNLMKHMPIDMLNNSPMLVWFGSDKLFLASFEDDKLVFGRRKPHNNIDTPNASTNAFDDLIDSNAATKDTDFNSSNSNIEVNNSTVVKNCDSSQRTTQAIEDTKNEKDHVIDNFEYILQAIRNYLNYDYFKKNFFYRNIPYKCLSRICITSLGSPLWYNKSFAKNILKFLILLRATIRDSPAVCLITMPMNLIAQLDEMLVPKIRNLVDYAIELESFSGSKKEMNPAFKEYHGLIHLHKITAINTLSAYMPETTDLAFKLRRKRFVIEPLHLPPELQETRSEVSKKSADIIPKMGCGEALEADTKVSLDF